MTGSCDYCTQLFDGINVDLAFDCGTHAVCLNCLPDVTCPECKAIRNEQDRDAAEELRYLMEREERP